MLESKYQKHMHMVENFHRLGNFSTIKKMISRFNELSFGIVKKQNLY